MPRANLVLIGMPGCGKTCIGRRVAERCGRPFLDTDAMVERMAGMSVSSIFARRGEAAFRAMEAEAARMASLERGVVIATGGGTVLFGENASWLREAGTLVHLLRPLMLLAVAGRPLSKDLAALAEARMPRYIALADAQVHNDDAIDRVAARVWDAYSGHP